MRNFLQRAAGPGIVALLGLGFDAADFFGSNALAYVAWTVAGLWAVYLAWPWIKRWRPFTLVPPDGESRARTSNPVLAQLRDRNEQLDQLNKNLHAERAQLSELLQDTKRENAKLKEERDELKAGERRKRIEQWRSVIRDFDFDRECFASTDTYSQMKKHGLKPGVVGMFEAQRTLHVGSEARGDTAYRYTLLDEVARIEKEWGLI